MEDKKYADYTIEVKSCIGIVILNNKNCIKFIKPYTQHTTYNYSIKSIMYEIKLSNFDGYICNKIIDSADLHINELIDLIKLACEKFDDYEVSVNIQSKINNYVANVAQSNDIWTALTSKPDYNLCMFKKRMLPYFNLDCKEWVKANMDARNSSYPSEIVQSIQNQNNDNDSEIFKKEFKLATKNNNFMQMNILPINKYPDMDEVVNKIQTLVTTGFEKQALIMFCRLMLSPKYCHIIKSPDVWDLFIPNMRASADLNEIVKYCYYFAMYILRQEETIMFSQVNNRYRVLFTLKEASSLPIFNCHIDRDPYILQLTNDTNLHKTIPFYLFGQRKINDQKEFKRRFYLATGGAFHDVDLKALGAAITGSILIPCVHTNPLEECFIDANWTRERKTIDMKYPYMIDTPTDENDILFLNYLEYYYPSYVSLTDEDYKKQVLAKPDNSDNDDNANSNTNNTSDDEDNMMYEDDNINSIEERLNSIANNKVSNTGRNNDANSTNNTSEKVNMEEKKNDTSDHKRNRKVEYNQLADIDISITAPSHDVFKVNAQKLYNAVKANCQHRGPVYMTEIETISSIKYKLYGPGLCRPMDIFRIPYSPAKMVKKFHVHAVKMYYNNEITMFRSCIAALISGVNETYKWFSCNKIPIDVLLKYAQRGISIILNSKERKATSNYLQTDARWGEAIKNMGIDFNKIYDCVTKNHPFFSPDKFKNGVRMSLRKFNKPNKITMQLITYGIPISNKPYGDLLIKDNNKQYPPDPKLITSCINYVTSRLVSE